MPRCVPYVQRSNTTGLNLGSHDDGGGAEGLDSRRRLWGVARTRTARWLYRTYVRYRRRMNAEAAEWNCRVERLRRSVAMLSPLTPIQREDVLALIAVMVELRAELDVNRAELDHLRQLLPKSEPARRLRGNPRR